MRAVFILGLEPFETGAGHWTGGDWCQTGGRSVGFIGRRKGAGADG